MSKLLTIKEAASYLNVSEMSIRRWTNSGKLKCLRVGKKKERRFREEDLHSYLTGDAPSAITSLALPEESHVAHFYKNQEEGLEMSLAYMKKGLEQGEVVVAVVPTKRGNTLKTKLHEQGVMVDILEAQQILTVFDGCKSPDEQIAFIDRIIEISQYFKGFRLVGDMVWTRDKKWNAEMVHKLETLTNHQRKNLTAKYVCQYNLGAFSQDEAFLAMQTHNYTIYNNKLNKCPYYELAPKWDSKSAPKITRRV
jgi:transcriptional repressor of dcmA and dcmR